MRRDGTLTGTVLGEKYRVGRPLGRGGTGRVYEAVQLNIGRPVAIKVLRPDLPVEARKLFELRFLREASRAGSLQHPNVVTIHDFARANDGTCYIVMELIRGRSLSQLLDGGPLPPERVLRVFEQVAKGLRASHEAGLVHRDIKPGNILLLPGDDGFDFVKLVDFGLVKGIDESAVTAQGVFLGTPNYVAPEQARGFGNSPLADIYSLGAVMYRSLTGRLPFEAPDATAMARAHVRNPYVPMQERFPDLAVPDAIERVVARCMAKEPDQRYPDAGALVRALRDARRTLYPEAPPRRGSMPPAEALPQPAQPTWTAEWGRTAAGLVAGLLPTGPAALPVQARRPVTGLDRQIAGLGLLALGVAAAAVYSAQGTGSARFLDPAVSLSQVLEGRAPEVEAPLVEQIEPELPAAPVRPLRAVEQLQPASVASRGAAVGEPSPPLPREPASPWSRVQPAEAGTQRLEAFVDGPVTAGFDPALLSGSWRGTARGTEIALDLTFEPEGKVHGFARSASSERALSGRWTLGSDGLGTLELVEDALLRPATYAGRLVGSEVVGEVLVGGRTRGELRIARHVR